MYDLFFHVQKCVYWHIGLVNHLPSLYDVHMYNLQIDANHYQDIKPINFKNQAEPQPCEW